MKFITENILYIAVMFGSGAMLLWPMIQKRMQGESVNPNGAIALINQDNAQLIDIRTTDEYAKGHIAQAKNVPATDMADRASDLAKNHDCLIVQCYTGRTAGKVAAQLKAAGAKRVVILEGGMDAWRAAGLPVVKK